VISISNSPFWLLAAMPGFNIAPYQWQDAYLKTNFREDVRLYGWKSEISYQDRRLQLNYKKLVSED
jgi:hypothetical protein